MFKSIFFSLFLISLASAYTINVIDGFPTSIRANSIYNLTYEVCLNQPQMYEIHYNITMNNLTGEEFNISGCNFTNTSEYICNISGNTGKTIISKTLSVHPYIAPGSFTIDEYLMIQDTQYGVCNPRPIIPPPPSYSSGGSGGGSLYFPRPAYPKKKQIEQNVTNITNSSIPNTNITNQTKPKEVTDTPHYSDNILEGSGMTFNIPKKKHDIKIVKINLKEGKPPLNNDIYIVAAVLVILFAGLILVVYWVFFKA